MDSPSEAIVTLVKSFMYRRSATRDPADVASKIARALNVSVEYLVTGVESVVADKPSEVVELFSVGNFLYPDRSSEAGDEDLLK